MSAYGHEVSVRVFGAFEVSVAGRPVALAGNKQRAVLAVLALSAGAPVPIEAVGRALWGEEPPEHLRRTVQGYVSRIRALLGVDPIRTLPGGYRLDVPPEAVDVHRFRRAVSGARGVADPQERRERLVAALSEVAGRPLADLDGDDFERHLRPALEEEVLRATELRVDADLELGRTGEVVVDLRELTGRHPLRESLWLRLLTALSGAGRRAEALSAYETVRRTLRDELGADPGAELRDLHRSLLATSPPTAPSGPSDPAGPAGPAGPATAPRPVPAQLPPPPADLTGRDGALATLDGVLRRYEETSGEAPLLVLVLGPGGIGKTTLALAWAHRVGDRFPDGHLHLDLRGAAGAEPPAPATLLTAVLRALGGPAARIPADPEERLAAYRTATAGRRLLVLADDAAGAEQVRALLPASRSLVLVTGRRQFRGLVTRDRAHRITLGPLDVAAGTRLLAAPGDRRVRDAPDAVAEIVSLCSGFPLALRLAGERVGREPELSLDVLAAELRDERYRLALLSDGEDPASDLSAVLSWSYQALDPGAASAYRCLGVHPPGPFGLPAAAALLGTPPAEARRRLDRLVAHNLLDRRGDRYAFHDLLRVHAADRGRHGPDGERAAAVDRMLRFYLQSVAAARTALRPFTRAGVIPPDPDAGGVTPADRDEALAWYERERDHVFAAITLALRARRHDLARGLVWGVCPFACLVHDLDEMVAACEETLAAAGPDDRRTRMIVRHALGWTLFVRGDLEPSLRHHEAALGLARDLGDRVMEALTLNSLCTSLMRLGRVDEAVRRVEDALAIGAAEGMDNQRGILLLNLGAALITGQRYEEGITYTERALTHIRAFGDPEHEGMAIGNLGEAHGELGRHALAVRCCREGATLLLDAGAVHNAADSLRLLADNLDKLEEPAAARRTRREALTLLATRDDPTAEHLRRALTARLTDPAPTP